MSEEIKISTPSFKFFGEGVGTLTFEHIGNVVQMMRESPMYSEEQRMHDEAHNAKWGPILDKAKDELDDEAFIKLLCKCQLDYDRFK